MDHCPTRLLDLLGIDDALAPRWDCTGGVRDLLGHADPGTLLKQSKMSPIFIHAWWRSSSTYVWSKLRCDPSLRCYYEPLHERLAVLDRATVEGSAEVGTSRQLRHPVPQRHFFFEYLDLIAQGRLRYSQDLAYARYLLRSDQGDEALRDYLQGLIGAATAAGRTPVLCFCRSQIAEPASPASVGLRPYRRVRADGEFPRAAGRTQGASGTTLPIGSRDLLGVFLVLWIASALQAIGCCDHVLDVDRLSADESYRQESSRWFRAVGCTADFSDCSTPATETDPASAALFEAMIAQAARAIRSNASTLVIADAAAVEQRLSSLSVASQRILQQVIPGGRT